MSTTLIVVASATPATVFGALLMLGPALRIRRQAHIETAAADAAVAKAEELYAENERTRNLPWHYAAIEAAPELPAEAEHEGEVLHVEHATGEHQLPFITTPNGTRIVQTEHPEHLPHNPAGLADLAEEVALVQALSDRPAEDDDEVGEEQPGEAQSRLLAKLHAILRWLDRVWSRRPDFLKSADQRAAEFWAEPPAADPFERFRVDDNPRGRSATTEAEELELLDEQWRTVVAEARRQVGAVGRHASDEEAEDTGYRGSRWAAGVEHTGVFPIVPAQRDGGDE